MKPIELKDETMRADNAEDWGIIELENGQQKVVVTLRKARPDVRELDQFKYEVLITWDYESQPQTARPPNDDMTRIHQFEDAVVPLMADNTVSYLMYRTMGLGRREWSYYTRDAQLFFHALKQLIDAAPHDPYPIRAEIFEDPDWEGWQEYRDLFD